MGDSSIYGSTRELMSASDSIEKGCDGPGGGAGAGGAAGGGVAGGGGGSQKRRPILLSRQRSSQSFDMSAKKIDQVLFFLRFFRCFSKKVI